MRPLCLFAPLLCAALAAAPAAGAEPEKDAHIPAFDGFVAPLAAEAGPLLSPPLGAVPRTSVGGVLGVAFGRQELGRTTSELVTSRLVLTGSWSPSKLERLEIGAQLVALANTSLHTDLPPAIDEWRTWFDLGPLRLHASFLAYALEKPKVRLALTPFLRLVLPTDTSRLREDRQMPIRRVLDDRVSLAPWMVFETGVALGVLLGPVTLYTHQGALLTPVFGEVFHFLWSMHVGVGVSIRSRVQLTAELSGLFRFTEDAREQRLAALAVCPGVRYLHGDLAFELSSRIGVVPDAYDPYGDFTLGIAVLWTPR